MTESLRLTIARDLTAIVDMCSRLEEQAAVDALRGPVSDSEAMMALGAIGNAEAAQHRLEAAEEAHLADPDRHAYPAHVEDWTEDEPPLLVLATWEDAIRDERGQVTEGRATVPWAADYIRGSIDWMLGSDENGDANFLAVDELIADLRRCRSRLENILKDGIRSERTKTPCLTPECAGSLLVKVWGYRAHGDGYRCQVCNEFYDHDRFLRAQADHLASEGAERYVKLLDGIRAIPRPEQTVRGWLRKCQVRAYCDVATHQVWVWWPDLRSRHIETQTRVRQKRAA